MHRERQGRYFLSLAESEEESLGGMLSWSSRQLSATPEAEESTACERTRGRTTVSAGWSEGLNGSLLQCVQGYAVCFDAEI
jgi:hypothetical protein